MAKMIAFCGLYCTGCDAFPTNQKKMIADEKIKIAEKWSRLFGHGHTIKLEDMNCDGCLSEGGRLWSHCASCEIRKCGKERKVKNCAYCSDYACEKLKNNSSEAKTNLEEIKKSR